MRSFVSEASIVRQIWGKSDTVLFIFAGAAAEFALNKAVDWLYFTGKLPADPIGRLFSTVAYAHRIVFSDEDTAHKALDQITAIHAGVEKSRGQQIPDWAYRDVLFMLMHYSMAAFEALERPMTKAEKEDLIDVFLRMGQRMGLKGLPTDLATWQVMREDHLQTNLVRGHYTDDLFRQYKLHLGGFRYKVLLQAQAIVAPDRVSRLLNFPKRTWLRPLLPVYTLCKRLHLDRPLKSMIMPASYLGQIRALDRV
jgi:hypothetical protein